MQVPSINAAQGFGTGCTNSADGVSSVDSSYWFNTTIANLLDGTQFAGTYYEYQYTGHCGDGARTSVSSASAPITVQYLGTEAIALSASADPLKAQVGTASKLQIILQPGGGLVDQVTTRNHLFCRTAPADANNYNFQGYMTATSSPQKDGSLSRIEGVTPYVGWSD